jgi:hypothetical protein
MDSCLAMTDWFRRATLTERAEAPNHVVEPGLFHRRNVVQSPLRRCAPMANLHHGSGA